MSRLKIQGFISLQVLFGIMFMQLLSLTVWPRMKDVLAHWQAKICINQLQFDITSLRLMSLIQNKIVYLYPLSLDHNWAFGWQVLADKKILWQKKPYQFIKINIEWHGFEQKPPLKFYPDGLKNHLNGYFQAKEYRLWLNRLGYSRITYDI